MTRRATALVFGVFCTTALHLLGPIEARARPVPTDTVLERSGLGGRLAMGLSAPVQATENGWWPEGLRPFAISGPLSAGFAALSCCFAILYVRRVRRALAESRREAWQLTHCDPVCGIANRLFFVATLEEELRRAPRGKLAVLIIAVDRFREINDALGHEAGDRVIAALAERLNRCVGDADVLARLAGAEFAILQLHVASRAASEALAKKLLAALREPIAVGERQVDVTPSIGIALYPDHAENRDDLLRAGNLALRRARDEGRNRYAFFDKRMSEELQVRRTFEEEMRSAMKSDALVLHYQPLWTADGKRMVGVEASVAWQNAEKAPLSAEQFGRFAEDAGLILPVSEWILRRACLDALRWPGLNIAVNIAPAQFRQAGFVSQIEGILRETRLDPGRLQLELNEKMVVNAGETAEAIIGGLRHLGVRSVLDDFGTGSSSLIYLRRFDLDKIKIDRSFFGSMEKSSENTIIVHAAAHLARALGLTVTADGVETTAQHRFLQAVGCHEMQGSLFSPPVPAADIDRLLDLETDHAQRALA